MLGRSLARATARERNYGEEREAPLGQLVWNPLPEGPVPFRPAGARGEATGQVHVEEHDPALSDEGSAGSEEEDIKDEEEVTRRGRGRSTHWATGGAVGSADNDARRRPWEEESPRHNARSPSPVARRNRTRTRAATDVAEADGDGVQSARRVSSALPEQARGRRDEAAAGWFGRVNSNTADGGHLGPAQAAADDGVPSAERLVASILQASGHRTGRGRNGFAPCFTSSSTQPDTLWYNSRTFRMWTCGVCPRSTAEASLFWDVGACCCCCVAFPSLFGAVKP